MTFSLAMLTAIQWGSLAISVWLGYQSYAIKHTQKRKSRLFVFATIAIVIMVLIPAVYGSWKVMGEFPMGTFPNCSPLTIVAIWTALLFTVALGMTPIVLVLCLFNLRKP